MTRGPKPYVQAVGDSPRRFQVEELRYMKPSCRFSETIQHMSKAGSQTYSGSWVIKAGEQQLD